MKYVLGGGGGGGVECVMIWSMSENIAITDVPEQGI